MPFLDLTGARLWFEDTGGPGTPVVFVHPAAATSAAWVGQIPAFTAAGYRCITYDLRGWGQSRVDSGSDVGVMSDDLEALRAHLGLERFVLIAAAYGGFGGLDHTLRFPERLQAFVLATSQGGITDPAYVAVRERVVTPQIRALPIELRELGPTYRATDPDGVQRWLDIVHQSGETTARRQKLALDITLSVLETLQVPTLALAANADLLAPPPLMRLIAERIPTATYAALPEAGHSAHWEFPTDWNHQVLTFMAETA
jgi:pimeloyl-ACP methyl ester carboxylesterase